MLQDTQLVVRPHLPSLHPRRDFRSCVDPAQRQWLVSAYILEALTTKQLHRTSNAVPRHVLANETSIYVCLDHSTRDPKPRVLFETAQDSFVIVRLKRDVRVQVPDERIVQPACSLEPTIERVNLVPEISSSRTPYMQEFHEFGVRPTISLYDFNCIVLGRIIHNDPSTRPDFLAHHRLASLFNERPLIVRRGYHDVVTRHPVLKHTCHFADSIWARTTSLNSKALAALVDNFGAIL
jgi:hypothetical protein